MPRITFSWSLRQTLTLRQLIGAVKRLMEIEMTYYRPMSCTDAVLLNVLTKENDKKSAIVDLNLVNIRLVSNDNNWKGSDLFKICDYGIFS